MNRFNLALRMLWRDSRSGELTILVLALLIAVTSSTAITLFADRLQRTMNNQAAEFLAADLSLESSSAIATEWLDQASQLGLKQAQTVEFPSVVMEHNELLLTSIKAVSHTYPLRGALKTTLADYNQETTETQGPEPGKLWVDKRILSALKLETGDALTVGEKPLAIEKIVTYEPDKRGDFYSFSPRIMMNQADLAATGVIQPGSHVHYFYQFSGDETALKAYKQWLKPRLNSSQRMMDIHEDRPELGAALNRAERYLGLSSIVVILIAGVAIAIATQRYTERHFNTTAILRCLGLKQQEILLLYGSQFLLLGIITSALGCFLGWLAQYGLFYTLQDLLPKHIARPGLLAISFGFITGLAILLGFAFAPLLRLKHVTPLRVLRRELDPLPVSAWLIYGLSITLTALLIWRYTEDLKMTTTILGAGLLSLIVLGLLVWVILTLCRRLLPRLTLPWRFALQSLLRNSRAGTGQILAFSITLAAMVISFTVRTNLIGEWQKQLPENAPNHFALNIFPDQLADFKQTLHQQHINSSPFYPVIRGRLVEINGAPVQKRVSKDSQGENATRRELSLTWSESLPEDNKISAGQWWADKQTGLVSVEQKLAESLQIKLGDELTFTIGSDQIKARVSNFRTLQWDTMKPNFYMIFPPGSLDAYPTTFLTSFYLSPQQKAALNVLVKQFPGLTILEVDQILRQFNTLLKQLTSAINYLLYFALLAGFTVLYASVYATLDNRIHETALMRTLGANRRFLHTVQLIEFSALGLLSGTLAMMLAEITVYALYTRVMHMAYHPAFMLWLAIPLISAFFIGLAGFLGTRPVLNKAPLQTLRQL